jgi:hypothetical protein
MSSILYYSNFCEHCKTLLKNLAKSNAREQLHFICIDNRRQEGQKTYIMMENGSELVMPPQIKMVPALLLLTDDFSVVYGEDIYNHLKPQETKTNQVATQNNLEPLAFSLGSYSTSMYGIVSDQFSFIDMPSEELKAQGSGGMRQMHNYLPIEFQQQGPIYTPDEASSGSVQNVKISSDMTIEKIRQSREQELSR